MEGYTCEICGKFIETRIFPSDKAVCKDCRENPKDEKKVIHVVKCCEFCNNITNRRLFGVDCAHWGEGIPNQMYCKHFKWDEKRLNTHLKLIKTYPDLKDFMIKTD